MDSADALEASVRSLGPFPGPRYGCLLAVRKGILQALTLQLLLLADMLCGDARMLVLIVHMLLPMQPGMLLWRLVWQIDDLGIDLLLCRLELFVTAKEPILLAETESKLAIKKYSAEYRWNSLAAEVALATVGSLNRETDAQ